MTNSNNLRSLPIIFLIILTMISSCATEESQPTITITLTYPIETQTANAVSTWGASYKATMQAYPTRRANEYPTETFIAERTKIAAETKTAKAPTPTITLTPTITSTPSPTGTPTPTLSPQEEDAFIFDLIENNGDCELPCLWGIQPGITTAQDYLELLSPIDQHLLDQYWLLYPSFGDTRLDEGERRAFASIIPGIGDGIQPVVVWIKHAIYAAHYENGNPVIYFPAYNAMKRYALDNMLSQYGVPSRVLLRALIADEPIGEGASYNFGLSIFYEDLGILIFYQGPLVWVTPNNVVRHCFQYSAVGSIRMYLHSPGDGLSLQDVLDESVGGDIGYFQSLIDKKILIDVEEATGVSVEEFYEIYKIETDHCLNSNRDIW